MTSTASSDTATTIVYDIRPSDYGEYALYAQRRVIMQMPGTLLGMFGALLTGLAIAVAALLLIATQESEAPLIAAGDQTQLIFAAVLIVLVIFAVLVGIIPALKLQKRLASGPISNDGPTIGATKVELIADGVVVENRHMTSLYRWSAIQSVETHRGAVFLMIDRGLGIVIPKSAFDGNAERFKFMAAVSEHLDQVTTSPAR